MPPVTTSSSSSSSDSQRDSIYGRRRRTASAESLSSSSQGTSCVPGNSSSSVASSSKTSSSSSRRPSPTGNKEAAVIAAAALLAKRSKASTSAAKLGVEAFKKTEEEESKIPAVRVLHEPEYQEEVVAHMHHMESETIASIDLMDVQPELKWFMRPYLVDFIVEIHSSFRLRPETLFLTMNIVDRYVSKRIVYKRHYQLVGCAALLIAAKFEDSKDKVPTVAELSQMCCSAYDDSAFTQMEGHVLSTIGWMLGYPTPEAWLRCTTERSGESGPVVAVARFLMELTLFPRDFIGILPSLLASGALMLARYICGEEPRHFDNADEVASAAQVIDTYVKQNLSDLSLILVKKYTEKIILHDASTIVRTWYASNAASGSSAVATVDRSSGLLPAQSVNAFNGSSFSTPRRNALTIDDDDDASMRSGSASPASMMSTPSRSGDEEEDDDDMPVTPLSLNSLHDPLIAAGAKIVGHSSSASSRSLSATKENHHHHGLSLKVSKQASVFGHQVASRPALAHWDTNSRTAL